MSLEGGGAARGGRLATAATFAWSWALPLLVVSVALKVAWVAVCVADGSLTLSPWEWLLLPLVATPQHLLAAAFFLGLYLVLGLAGSLCRPARVASTVLACGVQGFMVYFYMVAFRMAQVMGSLPTAELLGAAFQGDVAASTLFSRENIPYEIVAAVLIAAALLVPRHLARRYPGWPRQRVVVGTAVATGAWCIGGTFAPLLFTHDLANADTDAAVYLVGELERTRRERAWLLSGSTPTRYRTELLYGDPMPERARYLAANLDAFRRTHMNVVFLQLESTAARQASFMGPVVVDGEERDTTPHLRRMREHMLLLRNHYAVHPTSGQDVFSIACALYPYPHRECSMEINPRIPCRSFSELLTAHGYRAGFFHSGGLSFWGKDAFLAGRGFSVLLDRSTMPGRAGAYRDRCGIDERVVARAVADFITESRDAPFYVHYVAGTPHHPYNVPSPEYEVFSTETDLDRFQNALVYQDAAVGIIIDRLRELDLLDSTLIFIVADHGEAFGEHPGNRVHSTFVYEENVHVAAALYNPMLFSGAPALDRVTSHVDLLPTAADLLGLPAGEVWQGRSMLRDGPPRLAYFYTVYGRDLVGLRDGDYKVIWNRGSDRVEVFDLGRDPDERHDLASRLRDRLAAYRRALRDWRAYQTAYIANLGREGQRTRGVRALAELEPLRSYVPHPYTARVNAGVARAIMNIDGVQYTRGLGVHADSWYLYDISGLGALRLVGRVGREFTSAPGRVGGSIFLDGRLALSTEAMRKGSPALAFDLDLQGVRQVGLVAWTDTDTMTGDHLNWVDLDLITARDQTYRPGNRVWLDAIRPVGVTPRGRGPRKVSTPVRRGEARSSRFLIPPGATVWFDVGALGAERIEGTLLPAQEGGGPLPETVTFSVDGREGLRAEPALADGPISLGIDVDRNERLLKIAVANTANAEGAVIQDLTVTTSKVRFESQRQRVRSETRSEWALAGMPPAPPIPEADRAGWASRPPRLEEDASLWLRSGGRLRYDLTGLAVRRLRGEARTVGTSACRLELLADGAQRWAVEHLQPDGEGATLDVDLDGVEELVLEVRGWRRCTVDLGDLRLSR